MEKWIEIRKGGDFAAIGERFGISPVIARLLRNRDVTGDEGIEVYLHGDIKDMHDPHTMKDIDKASDILLKKAAEKKKIRIIGDYDIDGIHATYILWKALKNIGADVDYAIPDRLRDGYGINESLIERAAAENVDTILTCDNGIAAIAAIAYGKKLNMTVIVTDHHDIPYTECDGVRVYKDNPADAVINPKQQDCPYPYKELCGAAVAYKLVQVLYEGAGKEPEEAYEFLENAAFATVGDVMNLTGENRIFVKEGLRSLANTKNLGMQALIRQNKLQPEDIGTYHIGFVLGPCMNASGRLDTAVHALNLLLAQNEAQAASAASRLIELNDSRKAMTQKQLELAIEEIEKNNLFHDKVMVIFLPDCHESLAGIIAGRIRERYYRPVFVLTRGEEGIKGSGRSIEEYSMYEEMNKTADLFTKFGGHPMAAGLSMPEENLKEFRQRINENAGLTEEDLTEKVRIDAALPIAYVQIPLIEQLNVLAPFGKGNAKPLFADRDVHIRSARILGKNRNVTKLVLAGGGCTQKKGVYFGDGDAFLEYLTGRFGGDEVDAMLRGEGSSITISIVYEMSVDDYNGAYDPQILIRRYR